MDEEIINFYKGIKGFIKDKENFKLGEALKKLNKIIEKEDKDSEIQQIIISKEDFFIVKNGMIYAPNNHDDYFKKK